METFTRKLVAALKTSTPDGGYELVCVSRRWRDLPWVFRRVVQADRIVFSVPLVAWKQVLIIPLVLLLFAFTTRRPITLAPCFSPQRIRRPGDHSRCARCAAGKCSGNVVYPNRT